MLLCLLESCDHNDNNKSILQQNFHKIFKPIFEPQRKIKVQNIMSIFRSVQVTNIAAEKYFMHKFTNR
jgi:hypothetical protein